MSFAPRRCSGVENCSRGYTLIEVVIALAIFSGMLMLGGMALNQGLRQYQGIVEKGLGFWGQAQKLWMEKSFHSTIDYYVHSGAHGWFPYFRGDQDGISYVTLAPLAGDLPVVVWIRKEKMENGLFNLVYYELPVQVKSYGDLENDVTSGRYRQGKSVTLLKDAAEIRFDYFGFGRRDDRHRWRPVFAGADEKQIPRLVRIDASRGEGHLRFMYEIHVNSQGKTSYEDRYGQ